MKKNKLKNCAVCYFNPQGVCMLCMKEIPASYVMGRNQGVPRFCPRKKELGHEK